MARALWRATVITHRYLGIAIGFLMLAWFVSGIVMMYVSYPGLSDEQRIQVLTPISWERCCALPEPKFADDDNFRSTQLFMIAGQPSLRLRYEGLAQRIVDIPTGGRQEILLEKAREIAVAAAPRIMGAEWPIQAADEIERDQWTVGGIYGADRPLYRFKFGNPARTDVYVSSVTGEVVLWTTGYERFWNWLGAVPHWIYFTELRKDGPLWSEVVIWTSLVGGFLTVIGLYLGIAQLGRSKAGRLSPYRGWFYWHHITGLVFGVLTLTWVISGTFSMNPWGLFSSEGTAPERARLAGDSLRWGDIRTSLDAIKANPPAGISTLRSTLLDGRLYWLAFQADGSYERLDAGGKPAPVTPEDLRLAAQRLAGERGIAIQEMRSTEDEYYFSHHNTVVLPVYRVTLNDVASTQYYINPTNAELERRVDTTSRARRWAFSGLHRLDFAGLRTRPVWDIVVVLLMLGGTALSATGAYLALWRIKRDFTFARKMRQSPRQVPAE